MCNYGWSDNILSYFTAAGVWLGWNHLNTNPLSVVTTTTASIASLKSNSYNIFTIKSSWHFFGNKVGHLPVEKSRVTKFILDRVERVYAIFSAPSSGTDSPLIGQD